MGSLAILKNIPFDSLDFELPEELEASEPPEARGLARDEVRLMVSETKGRIEHTRFRDLPRFLEAGDVVVINTSATMKAALRATREDGTLLELRLSTRLPAGLWTVEPRRKAGGNTEPFFEANPGEEILLEGGGKAVLLAPYARIEKGARLWVSRLELPLPVDEYLDRHGSPIRYGYVKDEWPIDHYQTVYATEPGSAEMPSAGRAFTPELITRLVANGVQVLPLVLHTGVASLEEDEPPYEEFYRVPPETARLINNAREAGKRVIAVGTTVARALETVADERGVVHPGEGWTNVVITPERGVRSVDAMLTGLHEPRSSHLAMLEAIASRNVLEAAYREALREGYLWHEFGDLHLIFRRQASELKCRQARSPPGESLSQRDQTVASALADGFDAVGDAEPGVERGKVELDGVFADVEFAGDELVGEPFCQKLQHLPLARRERLGGLSRVDGLSEKVLRERRGQHDETLTDRDGRGREFFAGRVRRRDAPARRREGTQPVDRSFVLGEQ